MKNYQRLKGLIAASFTPMDAQGKINLSVIDKYADLMAKSDMTGVFVCGTTGESQSLTSNRISTPCGRDRSRCYCRNGTLFLQAGNCQRFN